MRSSITVALAALLWISVSWAGAPRHDSPPILARVPVTDDGPELRLMRELWIDVDAVFDDWARVYVVQEEIAKLRSLGLTVEILPDDTRRRALEVQQSAARGRVETQRGAVPAQYHTYTTLTTDLQQIAADHPDIVRLVSIGQTVQGREMWFVKISKNPDAEENEPEFAYISSMHGDEVVGKELLFNLVDYLTDNYPTDARVAALIDNTELWIMPSMNPDGTELGQRWNAQGVDLNRDFPDQFVDDVNTPAGRAPETANVMNWRTQHSIDLSSNFHGGALVANYPFDSNPAGSSTFSPTPSPDNLTFLSLARTYANNNPPMSTSNSHPAWNNGVTNGADWYAIFGGMQDWQYVYHGDFEVLVEVSSTKFPAAATLPGFWDDNLESMLAYMERVHEGVRGVVTDAETGQPLAATIQVAANPFVDYTDPDVGDYHRLLPPGTYSLTFTAEGREPVTIPGVQVTAGPATVLDVQLGPQPTNLQVQEIAIQDPDGALDPGQTAPLMVTLRNFGRGTQNVFGRLIHTGFDATVTVPDAAYPDIELGQTGQTEAPLHQATIDADVAPGRRVGFAVEWQSADGVGTTEPFFVDVAPAIDLQTDSTDVPVTIPLFPQGVTVESSVTIPAGESVDFITDIEIDVDIVHTFVGDLRVELVSPLNTTVVLHAETGGSENDIVGTYGAGLIPAESLDAFLGQSSAGTWTLRVTDARLIDGGSIDGWSVRVSGRQAETTTPEILLRELSREGDKLAMTWWRYPGLFSYRVYRSTDPSTAAAFVDVSGQDGDVGDTLFEDTTAAPILYYLVTGVGPNGEGPKGHFGE